jgi:hypothetical protein
MRRRIWAFIALFPVLALAQPIGISGRVIDDTGKPLPNVDVTLKVAGIADITATTQTDPKGRYRFSSVLPTFYDLYFEKKNFKPVSLDGMKTVAGMDSTPSDVVMYEIPFMEPSATAPVPYHNAQIPGTPFRETYTEELVRTTLCDLMKDWASFAGKLVQVRVVVYPPGIDSSAALVDPRCRLGVGFSMANERLIKIEGYLLFLHYLANYRTMEATVTGTFEHLFVRFGEEGYRFTIRSVSDVVASSR